MKLNNDSKKQVLFYCNGASDYITDAIFELANNGDNKKIMEWLVKANNEINILMKKTRGE